MSFDFFSLDYIYYPVSAIMWVWHKVFGFVLGDNNPWAWVLSVVFLVFTLRGLLFKPFMKQMNSQMKMQAVAPEMKKLRERYKDDKPRLAEEMGKLNKEAGVNPLSGCLPALVQAPVFIGLFHVLRSFKPNWGQVYVFGRSDVNSFVHAKLFGGAPLSSFISQPWLSTAKQVGLGPQGLDGNRATVIAISVPIIILAAFATHLTSRRSIARQKQLQTDQSAMPQAAIMNKVMLYVFPLGVLATGPFFPLAIIIYYLSNNTWTFGQLYVAHRIQDRKIAAESNIVEEAREAAKFSTPPPGVRPKRPAPGARPTTGIRPTSGSRTTQNGRPSGARTPGPAGPVSNGGRPAGTAGSVGGRPAAGRPVIQPSKKPGSRAASGGSTGADRSSRSGSVNGSAASNGAPLHNGSAGINGTAGHNGATPNSAVHTNGSAQVNGSTAGTPSLKKTGSTRAVPPLDAESNGSAGAGAPLPPIVRKKKPGRS